jgi:hypothetical protein
MLRGHRPDDVIGLGVVPSSNQAKGFGYPDSKSGHRGEAATPQLARGWGYFDPASHQPWGRRHGPPWLDHGRTSVAMSDARDYEWMGWEASRCLLESLASGIEWGRLECSAWSESRRENLGQRRRKIGSRCNASQKMVQAHGLPASWRRRLHGLLPQDAHREQECEPSMQRCGSS